MIFIIANLTVPYLVVMLFIYAAFKDRRKIFGKRLAFVSTAAFILCALLELVILEVQMNPAILRNLLYMLFCSAYVILFCKIIFRCSIFEAVFAYFLVKCYMDDIFLGSKIIQVHVLGRLVDMTEMDGFMLSYGLVALVTCVPAWLFFRYLLRPLLKETEKNNFWRVIWIIPVLYYIVYRLGISPAYPSPEAIWGETDILLPVAWMLATGSTYFVLVKMLRTATKYVEERERLMASNRQLLLQKAQYKKIQQSVEYAKKLDHDLHHQLLAISGYAKSGDTEGLNVYLEKYMGAVEVADLGSFCENEAINAIAQHFVTRARKQGIEVVMNLDIKEQCRVAESDLSVVVGNLLENALEACERQKSGEHFIDAKAVYVTEKILVIMVKNSYEGIVTEIAPNVFLSVKRDGEGIGTASIRDIVHKYHGVVDFQYSAGVFKVSILMHA